MIVADTHALIWWVNGTPELSPRAKRQLDANPISIAAITCWEIAFLVVRGRVDVGGDVLTWLNRVLTIPQLDLVPLSAEIAVIAANLPDPIRDPADRLIVATALHHQVPLVTKDGRIRESGLVQTVW